MFLRKETVKEPTGTQIIVPYCRECKSMEVETIQTCTQCGSHDIATPHFHKLWEDYNGVGIKQEFKDVTKFIYKCDKCNKEFDSRESDNYISYHEGDFETFRLSDDECDFGDNMIYYLDVDLCKECKSVVVNKLRLKLADLINSSTIKNFVKEFIKEKKINEHNK